MKCISEFSSHLLRLEALFQEKNSEISVLQIHLEEANREKDVLRCKLKDTDKASIVNISRFNVDQELEVYAKNDQIQSREILLLKQQNKVLESKLNATEEEYLEIERLIKDLTKSKVHDMNTQVVYQTNAPPAEDVLHFNLEDLTPKEGMKVELEENNVNEKNSLEQEEFGDLTHLDVKPEVDVDKVTKCILGTLKPPKTKTEIEEFPSTEKGNSSKRHIQEKLMRELSDDSHDILSERDFGKSKENPTLDEMLQEMGFATILKNKDGRFKCNQCHNILANKTHLRYHMLSQHKHLTWKCKFCDHVSNHPVTKRHEELHSKNDEQVKGEINMDRDTLKRKLQNIHDNISNNANRDSKKRGIKRKPYPDKSIHSAEQLHLLEQMKIFKDGDGMYLCNICDFKAKNTTKAKYHILSRHEGLPWKCQTCEFVTYKPDNLVQHKRTKHELNA